MCFYKTLKLLEYHHNAVLWSGKMRNHLSQYPHSLGRAVEHKYDREGMGISHPALVFELGKTVLELENTLGPECNFWCFIPQPQVYIVYLIICLVLQFTLDNLRKQQVMKVHFKGGFVIQKLSISLGEQFLYQKNVRVNHQQIQTITKHSLDNESLSRF